MKTPILIFLFVLLWQHGFGQVVLKADGPGDTYELISSILAPDHNPIEVPDCNHVEFGEHIDELFDDELETNVFRFYIHTSPDNDRCINFDRQRNEIKAYDKSPDNLLGVENEKVIYKWKFKLDAGFQSSPNFTHLHQLKSVGGDLASMPMYTLTTRKGNPDRIELRYAETDKQVTLIQTELVPFIGTWLDVTETVVYGASGSYAIEIKRVSDDSILLAYTNSSIVNWRPGAEFVRPKWGIYRSLINAQDLRDEAVLYASFSIEEIGILSSTNLEINNNQAIVSNPAFNTLFIRSIPREANVVQLLKMDGKLVLQQKIDLQSALDLNVSSLPSGVYVLHLSGVQVNQSKKILVLN